MKLITLSLFLVSIASAEQQPAKLIPVKYAKYRVTMEDDYLRNNFYNRYYRRNWDKLKFDRLCDYYTNNMTVFCDLKWRRYLYELRMMKVPRNKGNFCDEIYSNAYVIGKRRGTWKYLHSSQCDGSEKYTYI